MDNFKDLTVQEMAEITPRTLGLYLEKHLAYAGIYVHDVCLKDMFEDTLQARVKMERSLFIQTMANKYMRLTGSAQEARKFLDHIHGPEHVETAEQILGGLFKSEGNND